MSFIRQKPKVIHHKSQRQLRFPIIEHTDSLSKLVGLVPLALTSSELDSPKCTEDSKDFPLYNTDDRPTQHPYEEKIASVVVSKWPKLARQTSYYPPGQSPVIETKNALYGKNLQLKATASPSSPSVFARRNSVSTHPLTLDMLADSEDIRQRNMSKMAPCPSIYALDPPMLMVTTATDSSVSSTSERETSSNLIPRPKLSPSLSKERAIELFPDRKLPPNVIWLILGQFCDIPTLSALALTSKSLYELTCHSSLFRSIICYAQRGNLEAQAKLGYMHEKGWGVIQVNDEEAMYWYQKSIGLLRPIPSPSIAKARSPVNKRVGNVTSPKNSPASSPVASPSTKRSALSRSGNVYVSREPTYQVEKAEMKSLDGHFFYGWNLINGKQNSTPDAANQGFYHILLAGLGGHPWAQYWMGMMYENNIAIDNWKIDPIFCRASMAVGMSASPEVADQVRLFSARYWYVHAASSGLSSKAAGSLGRIYLQSVKRLPALANPKTAIPDDPASNLAKAFCWLRIAALKSGESGGDAQAQNLYGSIYETGMRVNFDLLVPPEEDELQRRRSESSDGAMDAIPAALSDPLSLYNFSHRRRSVSFPSKSNTLEEAASELRRMVTREMEEEEARALLFFVQESRRVTSKQVHVVVVVNGQHKDVHTIHLRVKPDLEEAAHWYHASAKKGNAEAECNLARLSLAIDGDLKRAVAWASSAARKGNRNGMNVLGAIIELSGKLKQKQKSSAHKPEVLNTLAMNTKKSNPELQFFAPMPKNVFQQPGQSVPVNPALNRTMSVRYLPKPQEKPEEQTNNNNGNNWKRTALAESIHHNDDEHFKITVNKKNKNAFSQVLVSSSSISNSAKMTDTKTTTIILHSGSTPGINIKKPTKASALKVLSNVPAEGSPLTKRVQGVSDDSPPSPLPQPSTATLSNVIKRLSMKMKSNSNPHVPVQFSILEMEAERDARRWYVQATSELKFEQEKKVCPEAAFNLGRLLLMMGVHDGNQMIAQAFEVCMLQNPLRHSQFGTIEIGYGMSIASSMKVDRHSISASRLIAKSPVYRDPSLNKWTQLNVNLINAVRLIFGEDLALNILVFKNEFSSTPIAKTDTTDFSLQPVSMVNEAIKHFSIAAEHGLPTAELVLARWNLWKAVTFGEDAKQALVDSITWYEKAAAHDDINAMIELGKLYLFGLRKQPIPSDALPEDLKKLQKQMKEEAKGQFLLAAENGSTEAACLLGEMCLEEAVSQENKQPEKKKGSKIGGKRTNRLTLLITRNRKSSSALDETYNNDSDSQLESDKIDAVRWLEMAVEKDCLRAKQCLNKLKEDKITSIDEELPSQKGRSKPKEQTATPAASKTTTSAPRSKQQQRLSFIPTSVSEMNLSSKYDQQNKEQHLNCFATAAATQMTATAAKPSKQTTLTSVFNKTKSLIHRKKTKTTPTAV